MTRRPAWQGVLSKPIILANEQRCLGDTVLPHELYRWPHMVYPEWCLAQRDCLWWGQQGPRSYTSLVSPRGGSKTPAFMTAVAPGDLAAIGASQNTKGSRATMHRVREVYGNVTFRVSLEHIGVWQTEVEIRAFLAEGYYGLNCTHPPKEICMLKF